MHGTQAGARKNTRRRFFYLPGRNTVWGVRKRWIRTLRIVPMTGCSKICRLCRFCMQAAGHGRAGKGPVIGGDGGRCDAAVWTAVFCLCRERGENVLIWRQRRRKTGDLLQKVGPGLQKWPICTFRYLHSSKCVLYNSVYM